MKSCKLTDKNICKAVKRLAKKYKNTVFLWALHKNIDIRNIVFEVLKSGPKNLLIAEAFSYETMIYLMKKSYILVTDSGGIQKEAPAFGKPVIILRNETERPEVIGPGFGFLAGSNVEKIMNIFSNIHKGKNMHAHPAKKKNPFGDGKASERIPQFLMLDTVQSFIKNYPSSVERFIPWKGKIYI